MSRRRPPVNFLGLAMTLGRVALGSMALGSMALGSMALGSMAMGCTAGSRPLDSGIIAEDGGTLDSGPPDAGRPDTGPRIDSGPPLDDVLIYAHSRDTLYTFSPYTNTVTEIGLFALAGGGDPPNVTDLAVDSEGVAFLCAQDDQLYALDVDTAVVTPLGDMNIGSEEINALSFLTAGQSPDGTETLIGATNAGAYYVVDRTDGSTRLLGQYPDGWRSSGDIVSVDGLGVFATLRRDGFTADMLARIDFSSSGSSVVTMIGPIRSSTEDFNALFGLGYWGANVYGFSNDGQLIQIDRTSGASTVVSTETGSDSFWGAGVTTVVPFFG